MVVSAVEPLTDVRLSPQDQRVAIDMPAWANQASGEGWKPPQGLGLPYSANIATAGPAEL